ncbi:(2Fe-2S)-binding protein [Dactylosporangium sp. CA-233914]|uniref:(2Fe-2S)-binding protein n=1 Tax=Dactylosporangium sp. CA-233914 TaxID=3239934 RepID=UPI003D8AF9CA
MSAEALASSTADGAVIQVCLRVDGEHVELVCDSRLTLLDALRDHLRITGPKKGCDHGQCGACTVHVGGRAVLSCLTLVGTVRDADVKTVHSLASDPRLSQLQAAFLAHDAFQCGFCTPGQLMSAVAALDRTDLRTDEELREFMSGNICRCAAYPNIVAAIRAVRDSQLAEGSAPDA